LTGSSKKIKNVIYEIRRKGEDNEEVSELDEDKMIGVSIGNISSERNKMIYIITELENLQKTDSNLELLINFIKTIKKAGS
jgi:hypothetical protein